MQISFLGGSSGTLPRNINGSSSFCKGPRTSKVWKSKDRMSEDLCKNYYFHLYFTIVTFLTKIRNWFYRDSPVSAVFWSPANGTIGKTALIGDWFGTKIGFWDLCFFAHFHKFSLFESKTRIVSLILTGLLSCLAHILTSWQNFKQFLTWMTIRGENYWIFISIIFKLLYRTFSVLNFIFGIPEHFRHWTF